MRRSMPLVSFTVKTVFVERTWSEHFFSLDGRTLILTRLTPTKLVGIRTFLEFRRFTRSLSKTTVADLTHSFAPRSIVWIRLYSTDRQSSQRALFQFWSAIEMNEPNQSEIQSEIHSELILTPDSLETIFTALWYCRVIRKNNQTHPRWSFWSEVCNLEAHPTSHIPPHLPPPLTTSPAPVLL